MSQATLARDAEYQLFKHYTALTFLVAAPIIIALPPRKLDLYTISLGTAFFFSANHLTVERTGTGLLTHVGGFISRTKPRIFNDLPSEKAEGVREQLRIAKERERELERLKGVERPDPGERGVPGLAKKVWMGTETEGWKERRLEEERKALEEGRGYGDLIIDYVKDAWRWDSKGTHQSSSTNPQNGRTV
ncbi:hypothetical protein FQN57_003760 [Myotisia sp. PD_48]|nr:hypothetical protein FQN57_003760 [Myotisia sp. PD_48]